jgi:hypothetical protein
VGHAVRDDGEMGKLDAEGAWWMVIDTFVFAGFFFVSVS